MSILGTKMPHLSHFGHNKHFHQKTGYITFMCLLNPNFMQIRKNSSYVPILRKQWYKWMDWWTDGYTDEAEIIGNHYATLFGCEN